MRPGGQARTGRRVGPYRLGEAVSRGGMGEVYRAFDERLERWVALKRIRTDLAPSAERRRRFRREAKAAAALDHPSIVGVHDLIETGDGEWIVMEWVEGRPLIELLREGPLDPQVALDFGWQLADALAAAHRHGILHRDLKTENVLITAEGRARVLDFGLVKRLDETDEEELTTDGALLGTYRAMSPEQSRGLAVTEASDLFAFGVLLYELLSGVSPFRGSDEVDTLDRVRRHRQPPLRERAPAVPATVSALVDRLLDKDPARRPPSAEAVAAELLRAATTPDVEEAERQSAAEATIDPAADTSLETASAETSGRFLAGRRRTLQLAVVGLLAAGLAVGWWLDRALRRPGSEAPAPPLYVAVAEPVVRLPGGTSGDGRLLAPALRGAVLDGLLVLDGVAPVLDDHLDRELGDPKALAHALAAEEVVESRLDCAPRLCRASLQRVSGEDGRIIWNGDFEVPAYDRSLLSSAVIGHLRRGFPEHAPRPGMRQRPLEGALYDQLLRLRLAHLERSMPGRELVAELERLRAAAPAAVEIYLLQAEVAHDLYYYSRLGEDLELVLERLGQARDLAPEDPQALFRLSRVALEAGRLEEARRALDQLDDLAPGDARVDMRRALLLERQGSGKRAMALLRSSVDRHPSWKALFELASMCYRHGDMGCARDSLERLLQRVPESVAARSFLAQIELTSGDPERAEWLYLELTATSPGVAELSNLGMARLLLGRLDAAASSFRQACELEPNNPFTLLNLADSEQLRGRAETARALYTRVLERTKPGVVDGDWQSSTVRAQALAQLGRQREAVSELQAALLVAGPHPQAAYEAAVVFAVLGEPISAVVHAERALGVFSRHWFELPWFDHLRSDPAFARLLDAA